MALVTNIKHQALERDSTHTETECTFAVITDLQDIKYLQLDTYGSSSRKMRGKKSQSIRFAPKAIQQLKAIFEKHKLLPE